MWISWRTRLRLCIRRISRSTTPIIFLRERVADVSGIDDGAGGGAAQARAGVSCRLLEKPFSGSVNMLANRKGAMGTGASLMKVFMPYLVWNTVFDNTRVTTEMGRKPVPFSQYSFPLLRFSRENNFEYQVSSPGRRQAGGSAA